MPINYQLIRSNRRKTLAIQIKQGNVVVRAPHFLNKSEINSFIDRKRDWLRQKIAQQQAALLEKPALFTQGCTVYSEGIAKILYVAYQTKSVVYENENTIFVYLSNRITKHLNTKQDQQKAIKNALEHWFKQKALIYLPQRLKVMSAHCGLSANELHIRLYKARWGSCNAKGKISLNYLLMMLPSFVIDYVIIHELCHLVHLNHSANFWSLVSTNCTDYKKAKEWLKQHQIHLHWQV
jgi:hypothetical protein